MVVELVVVAGWLEVVEAPSGSWSSEPTSLDPPQAAARSAAAMNPVTPLTIGKRRAWGNIITYYRYGRFESAVNR